MKLDDNLDFYANKTLAFYLRTLFERVGIVWDYDSDSEIRQIFEQIQNFVQCEIDKKISEIKNGKK